MTESNTVNLVSAAETAMDAAVKEFKFSPHLEGHPGGSGGTSNALMGFVSDTGKTSVRQYPCHNPVRSFLRASVVWSVFGYRTNPDVAKFFLRWLLSESPWSNIGIWGPHNTDTDKVFKTGLIFTDLDKTSASLLHNALVAFRSVAEWPKFVEAWYELVTVHSLHPSLAYAFLTCFEPFNQDEYKSLSCFTTKTESGPARLDKYDWPLDMARATESYVTNFLTGKAVGTTSIMFFPDAVTSPVNTVWGDLDTSTAKQKTYVKFLDDTYRKDFTLKRTVPNPDSVSLSSKAKDQSLVYTPESLLEVVKAEQKRLKLEK